MLSQSPNIKAYLEIGYRIQIYHGDGAVWRLNILPKVIFKQALGAFWRAFLPSIRLLIALLIIVFRYGMVESGDVRLQVSALRSRQSISPPLAAIFCRKSGCGVVSCSSQRQRAARVFVTG